MNKILVIGSNSFSGASFIAYVARKDFEVYAVSRSKEKSPIMLPYKWENLDNIKFKQLNLNTDLDELDKLIRKEQFQMIFNFAAQSMVGQSWDFPEDWMQTNVVSSAKFLTKLKDYDFIHKYVHVTTPEVYGSTEGWRTEDFNFNPSTPYAVSRAASDMLFKIYEKEYSIPIVFTRASNVYGEGQQLYRIIPLTIYNLLAGKKVFLHGGGFSTRSFIHMDDVSNATLLAAEKGASGQTYHISTWELISIVDLVKKICEKLNINFSEYTESREDRVGKDASYKLDSSKIRNELQWEEKISLDKGIERTIKWVENNFQLLSNETQQYIHQP